MKPGWKKPVAVKMTRWTLLIHCHTQKEYLFLRSHLRQLQALWHKHAKRLGYEDARS